MSRLDRVREIPIMEVFQRYGIGINRSGFCRCPFHHEKTPSCKVYHDSFYCFGCHAHGDVIDFVKQYENISFQEAVEKLGVMFGILCDDRSMAQRVADEKQRWLRQKAQKDREREYNKLVDNWRSELQKLRFAEAAFAVFEPENPSAEWSEAFCWAMKNREIARIKADEAMDALNNFDLYGLRK